MADGSAELLTTDDDGRAAAGPRYPGTHAVVVYEVDAESTLDDQRLAYLHTFYKRDKGGQPVPGTWVNFFVPDHLRDGASPSPHALRLVAERMGWDA